MTRDLWNRHDERQASPERISRALGLLPELTSSLEGAICELIRFRDEVEREDRFLAHEVRKRLHLANLALCRWTSLDDTERDAEEEGRLLGAMRSALEQIPRIMDDLRSRTSSTGSAPRLRPLRTVVEQVLAEAHPFAAQQGVHLDFVRPLPEALVDSSPLEVVLLNLVHNALHHLDPAKPERWAQVAIEAEDEGWCFSVVDNGAGIPEELQEQVFEESVQVDRTGAGDGLGLALARRVVEEHGGRIWLESREGEGTAVRFYWPHQDA